MKVNVSTRTEGISGLARALEPDRRAALMAEVAVELEETLRDHLRRYAVTHHVTAYRLGVRPTGNLEDARFSHVSNADRASVEIHAMGIRRALGPVEIRPKNRRALTIPLAAIAYGRRVSELARYFPVFRPKGRNYLAVKDPKSGRITPVYLLVRRATLPHEPRLLPPVETLRANCRDAALSFLHREYERVPA